MTLLLRCPKCRQTMKYEQMKGSKNTDLARKIKKCVYCGRSFKVRDNIVRLTEYH